LNNSKLIFNGVENTVRYTSIGKDFFMTSYNDYYSDYNAINLNDNPLDISNGFTIISDVLTIKLNEKNSLEVGIANVRDQANQSQMQYALNYINELEDNVYFELGYEYNLEPDESTESKVVATLGVKF